MICLPKVIPLGHTMLSVTKAKRSAPFNPHFSILASSPLSVQYIKLKRTQRELLKVESNEDNQQNAPTGRKLKKNPTISAIFNSSETFTHLFMGSTTMALGFSRFSVIRVFLLLPSVIATEIVFKVLSVQ